jgi:hypothetical protein
MRVNNLRFSHENGNKVIRAGDRTFILWLEFEYWAEIGDPEDDFFNMQVRVDDGRSYALNVWTYKYFEKACSESREENIGGPYLCAPDLFVDEAGQAIARRNFYSPYKEQPDAQKLVVKGTGER